MSGFVAGIPCHFLEDSGAYTRLSVYGWLPSSVTERAVIISRRTGLSELRAISENYDQIATHVVFVHGLSGHIARTWTSNASFPPVIWPSWLAEDVPGIGLWLVGYPAAKTNWGGYGVPIVDRADNVLARLLTEPALTRGNVVFVAHSLGGLVVEQILRNAERDAGNNRKAEDFLSRVRRVAFLGTPQRGVVLASIAKAVWMFVRPSAATRDLVLGSSQLRDLSSWYRKYSQDNGIESLVLAEGRPRRICGITLPKFLGTVVPLEKADIGLTEPPITVDEDHTGLSKPASRDADVYIHVRDFISRPFDAQSRATRTAEALADLKRIITENAAIPRIDPTIVDAEVKKRLGRLRKCRFFSEFNTNEETRSLVAALENGNLASASDPEKATALGWCARFLAGHSPSEAESILSGIASSNSEVSGIARAFIAASHGELQQALGTLCAIESSAARGAACIIVLRAEGLEETSQWLQDAGLTLADLDSDAKFFYLGGALEEGRWDLAFQVAAGLVEADFERSPGLILPTADAFLMQAVPTEFRTSMLRHLPVGAAEFPLRSEPSALEHRRNAMRLYERMSSVAESLGMPGVAELADDLALWLRLMDPEMATKARQDLGESMKDPSTSLRCLGLALQFDVGIDVERAQREVDRQTALSGGMSRDAAAARFALALTKESPVAAAAYVGEHREQLLQHLDWKAIYLFEIEMLAKCGQTARAESRLQEAIERGLTEQEIARLRHELAEATGADPIAERLAAYEESKSIVDLRYLVSAYGNAEDWQKAREYGKVLLELTGHTADARGYVVSLYNIQQYDEVLAVLEAYPVLLAQYEDVRLLQAQTLFECGRINDARATLQALRQTNDSPNARQLNINLAIVSGDWESLQGFVETEWNARANRTAGEILRIGQIAQHIGVARSKELVREAARRSDNNPDVLIGCYHTATAAGWENSPEVHQWMERATEYSGKDGPVRSVTIEDVLRLQPDWEKRASKAWDLLAKGEIPIFTAGRLLNRPLLSLYLLPALSNLDEPDVRRRSTVYAFSGAGGNNEVEPKVVAMDATALITAEFLDLFESYLTTFDHVIVPHNTLAWLFEEKARILFHQPSRVVAARELRRMVSEGQLKAFEGSTKAADHLVEEVGETLASLISEASSGEHSDQRQRLVVRGRPVYKASTLMQDEANLGEYEPHLCSSFDVVEKLAQKGVLTAHEAADARGHLNVREKTWRAKTPIADEAVLYLDDLTVSHLQFLGLLSKLHRAGLTAIVSLRELEEADALIAYEAKGAEAVLVMERLRLHLRDGLASGKVRLGTATRGDGNDGPEEVIAHPTTALLKLISEADVGVVDDRFINQYPSIDSENATRPLITTLDLLAVLVNQQAISAEQREEAMTRLRLANFALIPLSVEELTMLIARAPIAGRVLEDTAELRAVRESILQVRMSNMLQAPRELGWLNGMMQSCLVTLKEQWKDGMDEDVAIARSDWLLELCDVRGWTHRLDESAEQLQDRYRNWVAMLMTVPAMQPQPVKEAYWRWFESRLLQRIEQEDPDTYQFLVEQAKDLVTQSVGVGVRALEDADE